MLVLSCIRRHKESVSLVGKYLVNGVPARFLHCNVTVSSCRDSVGRYFETMWKMHALERVTDPFQASVSPSEKWGQRRLKLEFEFKEVNVLERLENHLQPLAKTANARR